MDSNESDERTVFHHSEVEENPGFNLFDCQRILFQMLNPDRAKRLNFTSDGEGFIHGP